MWGLHHKESRVLKNWCFWTVVLEKTLESPLDCKEIKPVNPKGNQSWILFGRTDAEVEATILWPPDVKNWPFKKDPDAGTDWKQEKGTEEDETVGWHHWLDGHGFESALGIGDRQGRLACCNPWGHKELDTTEWLNYTELIWVWNSGSAKHLTISNGKPRLGITDSKKNLAILYPVVLKGYLHIADLKDKKTVNLLSITIYVFLSNM